MYTNHVTLSAIPFEPDTVSVLGTGLYEDLDIGHNPASITAIAEDGTTIVYTIDILREGLKGKHAVYLVVEGPEVPQPQREQPRFGGMQRQPQRPTGLFDLHGIGFRRQ